MLAVVVEYSSSFVRRIEERVEKPDEQGIRRIEGNHDPKCPSSNLLKYQSRDLQVTVRKFSPFSRKANRLAPVLSVLNGACDEEMESGFV